MKYLTVALLILLAGCGNNATESPTAMWMDVGIEVFPVNTSIRALEVEDDQRIYYAGAKGAFGVTEDGGATWYHDSINVEGNYPEFRAIAVTSEAVFILSVGSPAYLLRSADIGRNWDIVYREEGPSVFYDAMTFWDDRDGIAMGDPVDGCISVIRTSDGGNTWEKIDCGNLPEVREGEAAFAASNTNIAVYGDHAWIATGGGAARIYHTADRGDSWEVYSTPILQGGTMTGIFSVDFYDESNGIIFGGDWEAKSNSSGNVAITRDGGRTWQLVSETTGPGYRSCVRYVPGKGGESLIAAGIPGVAFSPDHGNHWQLLSDADFYTFRFVPDGTVAWLAGNGKIARMDIRQTP